jgi:hypothetical protein
MRCTPPAAPICKPARVDVGADLAALVRAYRLHNRLDSLDELKFFREMPSLELAIHHASLAINNREKRFGHQCRIPLALLKRAKILLGAVSSRLESCRSFHDLHALLGSMFSSVRGLGDLYIYDTALRLGSFLKLSPKHVYLHAGTRAGARTLGLNLSEGFLRVTALPKTIQVLEPHEIEDFLCIYKAHFAK